MADPALEGVLQRLRRLSGAEDARERSDQDLLDRFVRGRDEDAFAGLVRRHGPAVFAVCRRVVGNAHDAEDAFQATFLILARKARGIRRRTSLPCWLHGVAYRVAANLRRGIHRRRRYESIVRSRSPAAGDGPVTWDEVQTALEEELARLPHRYRAPLILCYLQGKTRDEAARHLGWGLGTLRGRLERGRALLRTRLTHRGLTLPAALAAVALAPDPSAAMSPALISATVRAGCAVALGITTPTASAEVLALANGVSRTMFPTTLRLLAAVLVTAGLIGTGAGVLSQHRSAAVIRPEAAAPAVPDADGGRPKDDQVQHEVDRLRQENERLRRDLQKLTDRLFTLEANLVTEKTRKAEVHFKGKTLSYWLEQLRDRDPNTRVEAVRALAAIGEVDAKVIPVLATALKDRNSDVQVEAVRALAHVGEEDRKAIPVLVRALREGPSRIRLVVVQALSKLADPSTVPALTEALAAREDDIRAQAAVALERLGPAARSAVPELIRALRPDAPYVCYRAAVALLRIGPDAVPALADVLKDSDRQRRFWAVVALAGGGDEAVPLLAAALKDPDRDIRAAAAEYLGMVGAKDRGAARQIVISVPPHPQETVRVAGADVRAAVPFLRDALHDRDGGVRTTVAEALGRIGPGARLALPGLLRLWENRDGTIDPGLLSVVARAVWRIDPLAAARARMFGPVGGRGRPGFGPAFGGVPGGPGSGIVPDEIKQAIPTLIRALADNDPETRATAAGALGEIGPDAAAAIPALTRALEDESGTVRAAATKALDRVRDP